MKRVSVFVGAVALAVCAGAAVALAGAEGGKQVFDAKKCIMCHSLGAQKGAMAQLGGALDGVGGKRDAAWLKAFVVDPKSKNPEAKMPKQVLSDQELADLVDYLLSLK